MEEEKVQPQTAAEETVKTECCKKQSSDLKIFWISLLTAIIVVIVYHIGMMIFCHYCPKNNFCYQRHPVGMRREFKHPHKQRPRDFKGKRHHRRSEAKPTATITVSKPGPAAEAK